ncbi:hypothetical protein Q8A67_018238 [Cirrhinus molitorella]|uniref:Uncharacterized protein n=1 Tax=Cirrhinus molitorella TaxID=172907 RepID=A0AA88PBP7_9TELE|nr:hypothetical protein Q8A67_018238 [Cirrhinus molitorella]
MEKEEEEGSVTEAAAVLWHGSACACVVPLMQTLPHVQGGGILIHQIADTHTGSMWMLHALDMGAVQAVQAEAWPGLKLGWRDINVKRRGQGRSCPITLYLVTAIRPQNNRGGKD